MVLHFFIHQEDERCQEAFDGVFRESMGFGRSAGGFSIVQTFILDCLDLYPLS